jgi:hypothetical protein
MFPPRKSLNRKVRFHAVFLERLESPMVSTTPTVATFSPIGMPKRSRRRRSRRRRW